RVHTRRHGEEIHPYRLARRRSQRSTPTNQHPFLVPISIKSIHSPNSYPLIHRQHTRIPHLPCSLPTTSIHTHLRPSPPPPPPLRTGNLEPPRPGALVEYEDVEGEGGEGVDLVRA